MLLLECAGVSCQQLVTDPRFSHATLGSHNVFPPEMTSFASGSTAGSGSSSHSFQLEPVSRSAQGSVDGSNPAVRQDEGLQLLLQFMQQPAAGHGQQQPAGAVCSSSAGLQGLLQGVLAAAPNAWGPLADIQPLRSKTNGNIVSRLVRP